MRLRAREMVSCCRDPLAEREREMEIERQIALIRRTRSDAITREHGQWEFENLSAWLCCGKSTRYRRMGVEAFTW